MFTFDATQHEPKQVGGKHPPGNKFPFTITGTEVKDTKDNTGKYFEITFTSPAGSIRNNYNLWNASNQAKDIAVGQLAAVCHATGIMRITFANDGKPGVDGKELLGGKGLMDVGFQAGQEPSADKPEGGYVEVKKIYTINGDEPGKGPAQQQTTSSGFGQQTVADKSAAPNWGGSQANPQTANTAQSGQAGGWQQGATTEKPPWG